MRGSVALLAAAALAGCGSSGAPGTASQTATTHAAPTRTHRRAPRPSGPRVGSTQTVHAGTSTLSVTVTHVIDPLKGSGATVPPGTHPVGVLVRILNHGPGVYDSSATGDISLRTSRGDASPTFVPQGVCQTPLRDFDNYIGAGSERSGCVTFAARSGARLVAVRFSPHGRSSGRAAWAVG